MGILPNAMNSMSSSFKNSLNSGQVGTDNRSIEALRAAAARDPKASIRETAKAVRISLHARGDEKHARHHHGVRHVGQPRLPARYRNAGYAIRRQDDRPARRPVRAIQRQLQRQMGMPDKPDAAKPTQTVPTLAKKGIAPHVQGFIQKHDAAAKAAEVATGIPASFMLAQAAHESGWGKREITGPGRHTLTQRLCIKATSQLDGQGGRGADHRIHRWQGHQGHGQVPRLRQLPGRLQGLRPPDRQQ